jgi:hypothetical protein
VNAGSLASSILVVSGEMLYASVFARYASLPARTAAMHHTDCPGGMICAYSVCPKSAPRSHVAKGAVNGDAASNNNDHAQTIRIMKTSMDVLRSSW